MPGRLFILLGWRFLNPKEWTEEEMWLLLEWKAENTGWQVIWRNDGWEGNHNREPDSKVMNITDAPGYICRTWRIQTEHQGNKYWRENDYQIANTNTIVYFKYLSWARHVSKLMVTYRVFTTVLWFGYTYQKRGPEWLSSKWLGSGRAKQLRLEPVLSHNFLLSL